MPNETEFEIFLDRALSFKEGIGPKIALRAMLKSVFLRSFRPHKTQHAHGQKAEAHEDTHHQLNRGHACTINRLKIDSARSAFPFDFTSNVSESSIQGSIGSTRMHFQSCVEFLEEERNGANPIGVGDGD